MDSMTIMPDWYPFPKKLAPEPEVVLCAKILFNGKKDFEIWRINSLCLHDACAEGKRIAPVQEPWPILEFLDTFLVQRKPSLMILHAVVNWSWINILSLLSMLGSTTIMVFWTKSITKQDHLFSTCNGAMTCQYVFNREMAFLGEGWKH